jgi:hypothetical protein
MPPPAASLFADSQERIKPGQGQYCLVEVNFIETEGKDPFGSVNMGSGVPSLSACGPDYSHDNCQEDFDL